MCCTCEVCFLLIGSVVVVLWYHSCCFHLVFSITGFYIFFEETINIKRASLFPWLNLYITLTVILWAGREIAFYPR